MKCPCDSEKKSDWFRCKKISQKLKYLNSKCEQGERYFFVLLCSFHHSAYVPCEKIRWRQAKSVSGNQALHSNGSFYKCFERPYFLANQLKSNLYIFWPTKIQMSKVGARVATGGEVLRRRGPSGSRDEIVTISPTVLPRLSWWQGLKSSK